MSENPPETSKTVEQLSAPVTDVDVDVAMDVDVSTMAAGYKGPEWLAKHVQELEALDMPEEFKEVV